MWLTGCSCFFFFFFFFFFVFPPCSGKPLQTASPDRVAAAVGGDAVLPCRLASPVEPSGVTAMEWSRVDGPAPLTVHVVRGGKELVKDIAPEYRGRTARLEDGSLKLLGVQRRDNGTYRCVVLRESEEDEASVSLFVAQVSEVTLSVRRTSANQLLVQCESSGWSPEPVVSLLDSNRTVLAAQTGSSVRPDHLFSVRAVVNVAAAAATLTGSRTVTCRVEIPGTSLANENEVHISDEFDPSQDGLCWYLLLVGPFVLVSVVFVVFIVPLRFIEKLRDLIRRLAAVGVAWITQQRAKQPGQPLLGEYGDLSRVETSGASEVTANANRLLCSGVEASNKLAERDLQTMLNYRKDIISVGKSLGVHPALIAAIISRQSQAGSKLRDNGYGQSDHNCFGLMQINKHYHAVKGKPRSKEHIDQGTTYLIQLIKTMTREKEHWTKEQQLKGALAAYISGVDRVLPLAYDELDSVTPYGDFANDVVARAQWFAHNDF